MAAQLPCNDSHSFAVIYSNGGGVPASFEIGNDGVTIVTSLRLSLRFLMSEDSMFIDEEVYDAHSGDLIYTIGQAPVCDAASKQWLLNAGRYRVYGVTDSVMAASTELVTPNRSTTATVLLTPATRVKLEHDDEVITILSDDSDGNSPIVAVPLSSPVVNSPHPESGQKSSSPLSRPTRHVLYPTSSSIVDSLERIRAIKGARSIFKSLDFDTLEVQRVKFLPPTFNGNVLFELPPVDKSGSFHMMHGMDKRHDGHAWTKTKTSNIKNDVKLTFRKATCLGHLRCENRECEYTNRIHRTSQINEREWDGFAHNPIPAGQPAPAGSTLVCKICKVPPVCIAVCAASVYYVFGVANMTRAFLHQGIHDHPVKVGDDQEIKEKTRQLIEEQVERTPKATNSAIVMEASKELVSELLIHPEGAPVRKFDLEELVPVLEKCKYMSSPSIKNDVTAFKFIKRFGVMDGIARLRGCSHWAYVQENKFPGQGSDSDKVFVFKMSEVGPGSGVHLVNRMQPGGDLQDAWIMFDHVKRVKDWTTMACHVYDSAYCRLMTIAVCDMQSEDATAQMVLWKSLNAVMARHGVPLPKFKGFMADSAQANWNAVRVIYGSGDASVPMKDQERTCLFHWAQSLEKHTTAHIRADLQHQHKQLCREYKNAGSSLEAETRYLAIRAWWLSSGATTEAGLSRLDLWLAFWHFRYRQWGGFMQLNLTESELAKMPSCNLAKSMHHKWNQQSGNRGSDLYAATVDDLIRALMQVVRYYQYLKGDRAGTGPGKEELQLRVAQRTAERTGDPKALNAAMAMLPGAELFCTRVPHMAGEEVFGSQKRKADVPLGFEGESHRPDKVNFSHSRVATRASQAKHASCSLPDVVEELSAELEEVQALNSQDTTSNVERGSHVTAVLETACEETQWHIARLPKNSNKACFAQQAVTKMKCEAKIVQGSKPTAAPTYTGQMRTSHNKNEVTMEFYFCNDDIERCVKGSKRKWVKSRPDIPSVWPVKMGTNLSKKEILDLESAGFQLPQRAVISPRRLFGRSELPFSLASFPTPANADVFPKTRSGKSIRRNSNAPNVQQRNNCASAVTLKGQIRRVTIIPRPGYGCIVTLDSGAPPNVSQYMITISSFPECSCVSFKDMVGNSLGKKRTWASCKHLYYVFTVIGSLKSERDVFIHAPSFSFNEVKQILESGIIAYRIPQIHQL